MASIEPLQRGFVLHRRNYSDTSLLVDVLSAEQGRLPLIAKGARRAARGRGAQAALLQPFQPLWLAWTGRGEVRTLTRAEPAGRALVLTGDALYCGLYVNELLTRLLGRQDAHEALFVFYQQVLAELATAAAVDTALRRFELRLLAELGWAPELEHAAGGAPIDRAGYYVYSPEQGLLPAAGTAPGTVGGETLQRLAGGLTLDGVHAREARNLLRTMLAPHLGDRPLKSRELFRQVAGG
jgi:DNA repair protein RecO (recombination protein O)